MQLGAEREVSPNAHPCTEQEGHAGCKSALTATASKSGEPYLSVKISDFCLQKNNPRPIHHRALLGRERNVAESIGQDSHHAVPAVRGTADGWGICRPLKCQDRLAPRTTFELSEAPSIPVRWL